MNVDQRIFRGLYAVTQQAFDAATRPGAERSATIRMHPMALDALLIDDILGVIERPDGGGLTYRNIPIATDDTVAIGHIVVSLKFEVTV